MITKTVWLSYDLGVGGDYEGLYVWLDNNNAIECGASLACVKVRLECDNDERLLDRIETEISENIRVDKKTRVYVIRRVNAGETTKIAGTFLFGKRKANPWEGYGSKDAINIDDGE